MDAGRQDQVIIGQTLPAHQNALVPGVHAGNFAHQHIYVFLAVQDGANGRRNFFGSQKTCGGLVKHRAEQVIIVFNDGHAHRSVSEFPSCIQAPEATAHDHDMRQGVFLWNMVLIKGAQVLENFPQPGRLAARQPALRQPLLPQVFYLGMARVVADVPGGRLLEIAQRGFQGVLLLRIQCGAANGQVNAAPSFSSTRSRSSSRMLS